MKRILAVLTSLLLLAALVPTAMAANDTFTLMIYLCGTDLESEGAAATSDLIEMIDGKVERNGQLTVYVQSGGTENWQNEAMTNGKVERWLISEDGIELTDEVGYADMGKASTFQSFLEYGFENYPADRYGLIMWDHGSGATGGLCIDEMSQNALYYPDIYSALSGAGVGGAKRFAFVGFDACLMATYELACHLSPFADYMIASEELEPGSGWQYDDWLPLLSADPGMDIETLGKKIVDSFISGTLEVDRNDYATLSIIDLSRIEALRAAVEGIGRSLDTQIEGGNFSALSRARQGLRSFGEIDDYASDMIDITVFAETFARFDQANAQAIVKALQDVVVYSGHTKNMSGISGLSILVPFATRQEARDYLDAYARMNLSPDYTSFVRGMLSTSGGGSTGNLWGSIDVSQQSLQSAQVDWFSQYASDADAYESSAASLWGDLYGGDYTQDNSDSFSLNDFLGVLFTDEGNASGDASDSLWGGFEGSADDSATDDYSDFWNSMGFGESDSYEEDSTLTVETGDGNVTLENPFAGMEGDYAYTITLTPEQLDNLGKAEANLMIDVSEPDFECYVELGYVQDVVVDWDNGKIYGTFDGTWASLDGQMVCMYDQVANARYIRSLIPVTLNGDECYILVVFDDENPSGTVIGYTAGYTEAGMPVRGYTALQPGDVVVPQYDLIYWNENGEQQYEPFEGDPITVDASGTIPFGYESVDTETDYCYGFCLTDIYGDYSFTDVITLSF